MRQHPDFFGDQELDLIYIAKRLRKAKALEALLTERNIDYVVEPDTFMGGIIFRSARVGAFFYVPAENSGAIRALIADNGYKPIEIEG